MKEKDRIKFTEEANNAENIKLLVDQVDSFYKM